jgi:hypothetical protein
MMSLTALQNQKVFTVQSNNFIVFYVLVSLGESGFRTSWYRIFQHGDPCRMHNNLLLIHKYTPEISWHVIAQLSLIIHCSMCLYFRWIIVLALSEKSMSFSCWRFGNCVFCCLDDSVTCLQRFSNCELLMLVKGFPAEPPQLFKLIFAFQWQCMCKEKCLRI